MAGRGMSRPRVACLVLLALLLVSPTLGTDTDKPVQSSLFRSAVDWTKRRAHSLHTAAVKAKEKLKTAVGGVPRHPPQQQQQPHEQRHTEECGVSLDKPCAGHKLCYSAKSKPAVVDGCRFYLGDIAFLMKLRGPYFPRSAKDALTRRTAFVTAYCQQDQGKHTDYTCPVHMTAQSTVAVTISKTRGEWKWRVGPGCLGWREYPHVDAFTGGEMLHGKTDGCDRSGTEYAAIRSGLSALMQLNTVEMQDMAEFPCRNSPDGAVISALPAKLLTKGVSLYEGMYGKAFAVSQKSELSATDYVQLKHGATALQHTPLGPATRQTVCSGEGGEAFCRATKLTDRTTWSQLASVLLDTCSSGQPPLPDGVTTGFLRAFWNQDQVKHYVEPALFFDVLAVQR